jgi:hypothetical protein
MASQVADVTTPAPDKAARRGLTRKTIVVLGIVLVAQALLALCLVSAQQLLVPRNMPFGVAGAPSPVVAAVTSKIGLALTDYPNQSAAMTAINQGQLYGAYVTGSSSDTLIVVPAKSFFGQVEVEGAFLAAAHKLGRPVTVQTAKPLPPTDPVGGVTGLLLIPLLIGGYLAAVFVFKAAGRTAAAPWRALILIGYALVGALATDLIAGPGIGAYSSSHFWPLLPCFWLVTSAVVLAVAAMQALGGRAGMLLASVLFIIVGTPPAGGAGTYLLPVYWRNIGVIFPPQNAVTLIRNVIYFGGNNITTPLVVLFLYALAGVAVIGYLGWIRPARAATAAHARDSIAAATPAGNLPANPPRRRRAMIAIVAALGVCAIMHCLFATTYMSAEHAPKATNLPFGAVGSSPVLTAAEKNISLKVTAYPNESAVKSAIDQAQIWGALITSGTSDTLIVVPSISDLAPLDLAVRFQDAAKTAGQTLTVQQYAPVPLAAKDPFGLVQALMLLPLLIGGLVGSSSLMAATGKAAGHWRAATLAGYAVVGGLDVDLIVCYWLQGFSSSKFWIVWPICSLIVAVVAFVAAVLAKLVGPVGALLTCFVIILLGNPASGGATGVPYLPTFWRDIGPYLPPRNAYILLHQTVYFDGHGTTQALTVLLVYLGVAGLILGLLDWFRSEAPMPADVADAAAVAVPVGALP